MHDNMMNCLMDRWVDRYTVLTNVKWINIKWMDGHVSMEGWMDGWMCNRCWTD